MPSAKQRCVFFSRKKKLTSAGCREEPRTPRGMKRAPETPRSTLPVNTKCSTWGREPRVRRAIRGLCPSGAGRPRYPEGGERKSSFGCGPPVLQETPNARAQSGARRPHCLRVRSGAPVEGFWASPMQISSRKKREREAQGTQPSSPQQNPSLTATGIQLQGRLSTQNGPQLAGHIDPEQDQTFSV